MSLSQWATCHILSDHKESTSLFEAVRGVGQKRWLQWGETEKVAAVEIIEKTNPRYRGEGGGGQQGAGKRKSFSESLGGKEYGLNDNRKLRTEERGVVGKSPGHEAEKGDFQV